MRWIKCNEDTISSDDKCADSSMTTIMSCFWSWFARRRQLQLAVMTAPKAQINSCGQEKNLIIESLAINSSECLQAWIIPTVILNFEAIANLDLIKRPSWPSESKNFYITRRRMLSRLKPRRSLSIKASILTSRSRNFFVTKRSNRKCCLWNLSRIWISALSSYERRRHQRLRVRFNFSLSSHWNRKFCACDI